MADSDDDHNDRHSRDKFKRERNDYSFKRSSDWDSQDNPSNPWLGGGNDRYSSNRNSGRDSFGRDQRDQKSNGNYGQRNNRFNNDMSPPVKRFRNHRDYDDRQNHSFLSDRSFNRNSSAYNNSFDSSFDSSKKDSEGPHQPLMLNFKQFMNNLDDSIDHIEATTKYNEYKVEFRRKQLNEFFNAHKDEEW